MINSIINSIYVKIILVTVSLLSLVISRMSYQNIDNINKSMQKNISIVNEQTFQMNNRINDIEADNYVQLGNLNRDLVDLRHKLEITNSKIEILDGSINGSTKRRTRINKTISIIKQTIPFYRNKLDGCSKYPSPGELWSIAGAIIDNADEYAVPASLIAAIIKQESAFCNKAVSIVGAKGYMQLMPETAAMVSADVAVKTGRALRTWRGRDNIQLGTAYISAMLLEFDGNFKLASAAYNAGPTHVKKVLAGVIKSHYCDNVVTLYHCETADYMEKVITYKKEYDKLGLI